MASYIALQVKVTELKERKVVYTRRLDEYNHRIKIIRDSENRKTVDTRFYIPFAAGLIAKGKIVKMPFLLRNCFILLRVIIVVIVNLLF